MKSELISFVPLCAVIGGALCKPYGLFAVIAGIAIGMIAGRYIGWLYGMLILLLMATITIPWNFIRKLPGPQAIADGEQESLVQISSWAMILAAIASGIMGFSAGWFYGVTTALALAFIIALIAVIWTQLRLRNT